MKKILIFLSYVAVGLVGVLVGFLYLVSIQQGKGSAIFWMPIIFIFIYNRIRHSRHKKQEELEWERGKAARLIAAKVAQESIAKHGHGSSR